MKPILIATTACLAFAVPATAAPRHPAGSFDVAQSATGGPSGGPDQRQAVVPNGATGGASGGPDQRQAVVPSGATGGRSGGPDQRQAKKASTKKAAAKKAKE